MSGVPELLQQTPPTLCSKRMNIGLEIGSGDREGSSPGELYNLEQVDMVHVATCICWLHWRFQAMLLQVYLATF